MFNRSFWRRRWPYPSRSWSASQCGKLQIQAGNRGATWDSPLSEVHRIAHPQAALPASSPWNRPRLQNWPALPKHGYPGPTGGIRSISGEVFMRSTILTYNHLQSEVLIIFVLKSFRCFMGMVFHQIFEAEEHKWLLVSRLIDERCFFGAKWFLMLLLKMALKLKRIAPPHGRTGAV